MNQITAKVPEALVASLDEAAAQSHRTRTEVIRQALEYYLEDFADISHAIAVLNDPDDPELDWETVKSDLLRKH